MKFSHLVQKRKLNKFLTAAEIDYIVENYSNNNISDKEMIGLLDAFMKHKMSEQETMDFFDATYKRARIIYPHKNNSFSVDKHATGGVGDKTTLILTALLRALGVKIFKLTGARLEFTGGTSEKLSSFPNMQIKISPHLLEKWSQQYDTLITYAHDEISVFEKKLYHLRNVSQRVGILGMIVNSVMIKKMVVQNNLLIINLKIGNGTFFQTMEEGMEFAKMCKNITRKYKRQIIFIVSDMNQPLGYAVGNKIEVLEAMDYLEGKLYHLQDLNDLIEAHVHEILMVNKKTKDLKQTRQLIRSAIASKAALKGLRYLVEAQKGDFDHIYADRHTKTKHKIEIESNKAGYFQILNTAAIGMLINDINISNEQIDYETGVQLHKKIADEVKKNEIIATIWTNHNDVNMIKKRFLQAIDVVEHKPEVPVQIKRIIRDL